MSTLNVNSIANAAGSGAPNFPNGLKLNNGSNLDRFITWTNFTPTIVGYQADLVTTTGAVTFTNNFCQYMSIGGLLMIHLRLLSMTFGANTKYIKLTLPSGYSVNAAAATFGTTLPHMDTSGLIVGTTFIGGYEGNTDIAFNLFSGASFVTGVNSLGGIYMIPIN